MGRNALRRPREPEFTESETEKPAAKSSRAAAKRSAKKPATAADKPTAATKPAAPKTARGKPAQKAAAVAKTAAKPVAKSAAKPVAKPAAKPAPEPAKPAPRASVKRAKPTPKAAAPERVSVELLTPAADGASPPLPPAEADAKAREEKASAEQPKASAQGEDAGTAKSENPFLTPEVEAFAVNIGRFWEHGARALAAYARPAEKGQRPQIGNIEVTDMVRTLGQVVERWASDPARVAEAQRAFTGGFFDLWSNTLKRLSGEKAETVVSTEPTDKRFKDPEWSEHPMYDFLKQAYLHTSRWADRMVEDADDLDDHTRHKATFYVKLLSSAASPSNFIATNPELLRETLATKGENLVRGMAMMNEDIDGNGELRIRQTDRESFEVGRNIANTPGKVIYRNDVFELLQYSPMTETVRTRPLVIVPPWINKYYILDLAPEKSLIRWCVEQGLTVFCISWVNPDSRHADKGFDDYMRDGIMRAVDIAREVCDVDQVDAVGYCVGGTLLSITLAYMAATGMDKIATATLLTAQIDFTYAGDLKVFVDEEQISAVEARMADTGYLEGARMASAFNMLRSQDLIWPYFVNNYMRGRAPLPFDLLYWNSDATRMPARNHSFYLRNCYLTNDLGRGAMEMYGVKLDIGKVKTPVYSVATKEDHIAPAKSVFFGIQKLGGPVTFVLTGSGHIAGIVNPPAKKKYQHWLGGKPKGELKDWAAAAEEIPGSWWPNWREWLASHDGTTVPARTPGEGLYPAIEDAPGSYVKVKV